MRGERVKVGESRTLARERGVRARAWRGKGGLHGERRQIPRRKGRTRKKSLPKRSRIKHFELTADNFLGFGKENNFKN